ncbi:hypothetical protein GCM10027341_47730 [Spirosoma knui]
MWTEKRVSTTIRVTVDGQRMILDLSVDNLQAVDMYVTDVGFRYVNNKPEVDRDYLPLFLNANNEIEANLFIKPLNPKKRWTFPPSFYTHIIKGRSRYQRQWVLPYPVRISRQNNHGIGSIVSVSRDLISTIGVIIPPASYPVEEVDINGELLYQFKYNALPYQVKQTAVSRDKGLQLQVVD